MIFLEKPEHFGAYIETVGCHIVVGNELLFLKRAPGKDHPNVWSVPAGKIDPGETPDHALLREVEEETGIHLDQEHIVFFKSLYVMYADKNFLYHLYGATLTKKPAVRVNHIEHTEYAWYTP
ncbi:MAG: hypothetical protein COU33_00015, partial [Candidatus Magasanikbacteria bacterium CG10_big_fil_rev_8_21_14_0_10_43_6]